MLVLQLASFGWCCLGEASEVDLQEMILEVKEKKESNQALSAFDPQQGSTVEIDQKQIERLPLSQEVSLPRLLAMTTPGVVQGPFGQVFVRGNHANIQYQLDGVQLPDSPSNTFAQMVSPRNIDHMEIITGGIPAEYGQRLSAVVNITTKSGTELNQGEAELNYGSYSTFSPHFLYGGSNHSGDFRYFFSVNYSQTDRSLDTPQPLSTDLTNQIQGSSDSIHNRGTSDSEFTKLDWVIDDVNRLSFVAFHSESFFQIPNYPSSFSPTDPYFQAGYTDFFGNTAGPGNTTFTYYPSNRDDSQLERNLYTQLLWTHTLNHRSFLKIAPYYKHSMIIIKNDPINDLATSASGSTPIVGASPASIGQNRYVNYFGLKTDYSFRATDRNLIKIGSQFQLSYSGGWVSAQSNLASPAVIDSSEGQGFFESFYLQDEYSFIDSFTLHGGVRLDAVQFSFSGIASNDYLVQPRIGASYLFSEKGRLHLFYGKLFQPVSMESLRNQFDFTNSTALPVKPYNIQAEKDDYYELGVDYSFIENQSITTNIYYKNGTNVLDDQQLPNTSIAQPYNFATGYAYGAEFSVAGSLDSNFSERISYSYQIAKGKGISAGVLTNSISEDLSQDQFLDHVQVHTIISSLTYSKNGFWCTLQGLYGSGLRTGQNNSLSLPGHFTLDTSVGYDFRGLKISGDALNVFNNIYPITISNGFNGSYYAAGRQLFIRLTKTL